VSRFPVKTARLHGVPVCKRIRSFRECMLMI